jgi:hypothetical protein
MHALLATVQAMSATICCWRSPPASAARSIWRPVKRCAGCKILAITGFSPNALQQQATHCLYTIAEEQATRSAASPPPARK